MSEAGSDQLDPTLLFTPRKPTKQFPNDPPDSDRPFIVAVPMLASAEKRQFKELPQSFKNLGVDFDEDILDGIAGEYAVDGKLFYFVRFKDGVSHRFPARHFKLKFRDMVKVYEQQKEENSLPPFDPSSQDVHPDSRVIISLSINKKLATAKKSRSVPAAAWQSPEEISEDEVPDSEDGDTTDDDDFDDDGNSIVLRRSTRTAAKGKAVRNLPFSPKKTRSRTHRAAVNGDSDDELAGFEQEESSDVDVRATRHSTRTRRGLKTNLADVDAYEDEDEEEEDSDYFSNRIKTKREVKQRKTVRAKESRPAYGNIRPVADLRYDAEEDAATATLRAHRDLCEKCQRKPTHELLVAHKKRPKGRGRKKKTSDDEDGDINEEEKLTAMGGWVRCLKCPVVAHWCCLASSQRDEILKAAKNRDKALWIKNLPPGHEAKIEEDQKGKAHPDEPKKRSSLDAYQTTEFICTSCMRGGICMGCKETCLEQDTSLRPKNTVGKAVSGMEPAADSEPGPCASGQSHDGDVVMTDATNAALTPSTANDSYPEQLLFRCLTCKRLAHYSHLPNPFPQDVTSVRLAQYYQNKGWECGDCLSFVFAVDKILAWRPYPPDATEPSRLATEPPSVKSQLPREYLVKWVGRSYRRVQWVPHLWLAAKHTSALRNFLISGSKVELLEAASQMGAMDIEGQPAEKVVTEPNFEITAEESRDSSTVPDTKAETLLSDAVSDAELRIPPAWKTVDRVLDILLWYPLKRNTFKSSRTQKKRKGKGRVVDSDEDGEDDDESAVGKDDDIMREHIATFRDGEQPSDDLTETLDEWEARTGKTFGMKQIDRVVWAFLKWDDLGYEETTWDSPPRCGEFGYTAYKTAFERFVVSRSVTVPVKSRAVVELFQNRPENEYRRRFALKDGQQPDLGQNQQFKLMPFQIDGFNWLCNNWWNHQHCILADEMGLGKTVQISTFLGTIIEKFRAWPALVVVPNSTITNWVRELARWAPGLRVVPYYGEKKAREVVKEFELSHYNVEKGTTGAKFHVLVTTYDTLVNPKDLTSVFKRTPRWEVLVVDEGQRLKNDSSLLFKKLNELNTIHRIIMTGTPLNNNIRELFNLMNFLDPDEWHDLESLEKDHEELTEVLVKQLHCRLKPYFLRRIKSEVLQLPPKNEVIVPVSMTPLQKNVYRSILSKNFEILKTLTDESKSKISSVGNKSSMNNVLMQLRKCLQHPYLFDRVIEPENLSNQEAHEKLIDGSAKLRLLKVLLRKLYSRGHRALLFSQFVINLDIIEDFLNGEGHKYLRLDGNTKQADRQKDMDEFNRPGSDVFIYLLSTRAGGVGINLWSADTVIIYDPDFNPHQDLQAIARSHRYGQQKTCLVFKLMVKDSAEERIMQTGKKKLVLDHLIVQKMDDQDSAGEDLQSILTFGAKALFDEGHDSKDITYTDHDIEKLIEKTEVKGDQEEKPKEGGLAFSFAKIWAADKDLLEELEDNATGNKDAGDSWAQTLERIKLEQLKEKEHVVTGRGARRRAAALFPQQNLDFDDSPVKKKKKRKTKSKSADSEESDSDFASVVGSELNDSDDTRSLSSQDLKDLSMKLPERSSGAGSVSTQNGKSGSAPRYRVRQQDGPLSPIDNHSLQSSLRADRQLCGLCGTRHGPKECYMTESSENLVEYRRAILEHGEEEPLEDRKVAIQAIDETLFARGKIHLIAGQPLSIVDYPASGVSTKKRAKVDQRDSQLIPQASTSTHSRQIHTPSTAPFPLDFSTGSSPAPTAGLSKRPSSPACDEGSSKKRPKSHNAGCVVCGNAPHHLVKDCPVVLQGPKSVSREIKRLDSNPAMSGTVHVLRKILSRQKKRELLSQSGSAKPDASDVAMANE